MNLPRYITLFFVYFYFTLDDLSVITVYIRSSSTMQISLITTTPRWIGRKSIGIILYRYLQVYTTQYPNIIRVYYYIFYYVIYVYNSGGNINSPRYKSAYIAAIWVIVPTDASVYVVGLYIYVGTYYFFRSLLRDNRETGRRLKY